MAALVRPRPKGPSRHTLPGQKPGGNDKLPWAPAPESVVNLYCVEVGPWNFLPNPSGNIIALNLRGDALQAALARFIN